MIQSTKQNVKDLKQRVFKNYQQMLTFAIDLGYSDRDYSVETTGTKWVVRYR